jgi:DnaK suppressor protein
MRMGNQEPTFSAVYLECKRRELMQLRAQLRKTTNAAEAEERRTMLAADLQVHEHEDDAQRLDALEKEGNLVRRDIQRIARVERALEKLDEGTYGFSDVSGRRIPDNRLDVMPDAINTVAEQEASERGH